MLLSEGISEEPDSIFRMNYIGQVPMQTGSYVVTASCLDENDEPSGGGIVAEFDSEADAIRCIKKILAINAKHDPGLINHNSESTAGEMTRDEVQELVRQKYFKPGEYVIHAKFINRDGIEVNMEVCDFQLREEISEVKMKEYMIKEASSLGLHNFGMDVYVGNYPNGHPVTLDVHDEHGNTLEFVQNFNGSGYPIPL